MTLIFNQISYNSRELPLSFSSMKMIWNTHKKSVREKFSMSITIIIGWLMKFNYEKNHDGIYRVHKGEGWKIHVEETTVARDMERNVAWRLRKNSKFSNSCATCCLWQGHVWHFCWCNMNRGKYAQHLEISINPLAISTRELKEGKFLVGIKCLTSLKSGGDAASWKNKFPKILPQATLLEVSDASASPLKFHFLSEAHTMWTNINSLSCREFALSVISETEK